MERKYKILVTGACGITSRAAVRSLRMSEFFKDKCVFIGTDICSNMYGVYEGLYDKVYYVPLCRDSQYRSVMQSIIDENEIEYAIIIPEPEVSYWSMNPFPVKFMRIPPLFAQIALSKRRLYENLEGSGLAPDFQIVDKEHMMSDEQSVGMKYPMWIRDYSEGTTSATGAFLVHDYESLKAWLRINPKTDSFMLSEYLPGRILACFLLYDNGTLVKYGVVHRMEYIMAKTAISGITGNICKGKMLNEETVCQTAQKVVNELLTQTNETMNGLIVADFREDTDGQPKITEINIRPLSFTSTLASAGLNFPEIQLLILTGERDRIPQGITEIFSEDNAILRDVDGLPLYVEHFKDRIPGEFGVVMEK